MSKNLVEQVIKEQKIRERITELEKERDGFVLEANKQVAAYNGAIGELKRLIEPPKEAKENKPAEKEPL